MKGKKQIDGNKIASSLYGPPIERKRKPENGNGEISADSSNRSDKQQHLTFEALKTQI